MTEIISTEPGGWEKVQKTAELAGRLAIINAKHEYCTTGALAVLEAVATKPGPGHDYGWRKRAAGLFVPHNFIPIQDRRTVAIIVEDEHMQGAFTVGEWLQHGPDRTREDRFYIGKLSGTSEYKYPSSQDSELEASIPAVPYKESQVASDCNAEIAGWQLKRFARLLEVTAEAASVSLN